MLQMLRTGKRTIKMHVDFGGSPSIWLLLVQVGSLSDLVREELAQLYLGRAASHMQAREWVEGWKNAECGLECKRGGQLQQTPDGRQLLLSNAKTWAIGGKCLAEMGRWAQAKEWLDTAVQVEGREGEDQKELLRLLATVTDTLERRERA